MTTWDQVEGPWDLVVVGGGVTGAAVLREAARCGLKALLVEQRDYAWGTSSRSTKLVHGGLRYLVQGDLRLVRDSIRERDRLVRESQGLAQPVPFVLVAEQFQWKNTLGVGAYSLLAGRRPAPLQRAGDLKARLPSMDVGRGMVGSAYEEATLDDARLVLRLLQEARAAGATALNGVRVESLVRSDGAISGVALLDVETGRKAVARAGAVVNATGVWTGTLAPGKLRPLRGSHLLFSADRVPLRQAVSFRHPRDRRWVCAVPWEDVVVLGTTDLDHDEGLAAEPRVSVEEFDYLLEAAQALFAPLALTAGDVVSCFAGVRPIVDEGPGKPSQASREHFVTEDRGLVTVTGGKLTTCRQMAHDALRLLRKRLPALSALDGAARFLDEVPADVQAPARLVSRYGAEAARVAALGTEPVGATQTLWGELRWALRHEQVRHLDDLLLRRVRVGLMLPLGGAEILPRVRALCGEELGWDAARWSAEQAAYERLWLASYAPPQPAVRKRTG